MGKIILDSVLRNKLPDLSEQMEVCDESGRTVGLFLPLEQYKHLLRNVRIPLSDEEIERRRQEGDGCSLPEFWARMSRP
jgi:hypothetical protein